MIAIRTKGISKSYRLYSEPIDRLKEALNPFNKRYHHDFFALRDISFDVAQGEVLGIVGNNGAGKSTLLKILTGVLTPTSGEVEVHGKIASLLELGAGFNPEYTGMENIYFQGTLMGFTRPEMAEKVDEIVAFADIGEFIHQSVKMYSSGMFARLAFAVATSVKPDILIIDEALSVGDGAFARKSFDRIMELREGGCTILFCSHSLYQIEVLCNKVMWIDQGKIQALGESGGVVRAYQRFLENGHLEVGAEGYVSRSGTNTTTRIEKIRVYDENGNDKDVELSSKNSDLSIDISIAADLSLPTPTVGILITDDKLKNITSCGSFYDGVAIDLNQDGKGEIRVTYPKIGLLQGRYYVHVFLMCENAIHIYDSVQSGGFEVTQRDHEIGVVSLPRCWNC